MIINNKNRKVKEKIILLTIILLVIPLVLAQNDPGHDTLYIEEQGDSDLNGTLNITQNLTVNGGEIKQPGGLTLFGDDSTPASGPPYISGTSGDNLYLDAQGNVYIKWNMGGGTVYIGSGPSTVTDLNVSGNITIQGALYFGDDERLYTSAAAGAASSDLYWGDKLLCNTSQSNCGWVTSATGGGDITAVYTNDKWLDGGSDTGDVTLTFNESELNATIDARENDTNTWWTIDLTDFINNSNTLELNWTIINATIDARENDTTIGNCSGDQSCTNILYDSNASDFAAPATCSAGQFVQNTTSGGVECSTPTGAGDITAVNTSGEYLYGGATSGDADLYLNETKLNYTIDARENDTAYTAGDYLYLTGTQFNVNETELNSTIDARENDTTIGNCSADQSCTNILYDTNVSELLDDTTIGNCSGAQSCTGVLYDTNFSQLHQFSDCGAGTYVQNTTATGVECDTPTDTNTGNCSADQSCTNILYDTNASDFTAPATCPPGQYVQNTTSGGVECSTPTGAGDITSVQDGDKWLDGGADTGDVTLTFNESEMNDTIDIRDDMCNESGNCGQLFIDTHRLDTATSGSQAADLWWGNDLACDVSEANCGWLDIVQEETGTTTPLTFSGCSAGICDIGMDEADSTTDGWLNSTDWNTFNNKAGTGTCTGSNVVQNTTTSGVQCTSISETDPQVGTYTNTYVCYGTGSQVTCADAGITYATGTDSLTLGGNLTVTGGNVVGNSASDDLWLQSSDDVFIDMDYDNGDTGVVSFRAVGSTEVAQINEAGDLQIDGELNIDGTGTHDMEGTLTVDDIQCEASGCINATELSPDIAGDGLDSTSGQLSVDVTDIIAANQGIVEIATNNIGLSQSCGDTEILKWNNTANAWECENDENSGGNMSSWTLTADSGSNQIVNEAETVNITGGTDGIDTTVGATNKITITFDPTELPNDDINESKVNFTTTCGTGNHLFINGNDLDCEADDDQPDSDSEVPDAITISGGALLSNTVNGTWTTNAALTIGDNGDNIIISAANWDVSSGGVISSATWQGNAIADSYITNSSTWHSKAGTGTCTGNNVAQNTTTSGVQCRSVDSTPDTIADDGDIDDTDMAAEDFGDFTCTGEEDGCTLDSTYDNYGDWNACDDDGDCYNIVSGNTLRFSSANGYIVTNMVGGDNGDENITIDIGTIGVCSNICTDAYNSDYDTETEIEGAIFDADNAGSIGFTDANRYWLYTATNWGIYFDTDTNTIEFHGGGTDRANIDLDTGNMQIDGTLTTTGDVDIDGNDLTSAGDLTITPGGGDVIIKLG